MTASFTAGMASHPVTEARLLGGGFQYRKLIRGCDSPSMVARKCTPALVLQHRPPSAARSVRPAPSCLAHAGRTGDEQILLAFNPFALCQPLEHGPVQTTM